jgi:hypothetical protein
MASWALRHSSNRRTPSSMEISGTHPSIFSILARLKSSCLVTLDRTLDPPAAFFMRPWNSGAVFQARTLYHIDVQG